MNQMTQIQNELKQGATINEVCYKYNMTFKYLLTHIPNANYRKTPKKRKNSQSGVRVSKYIIQQRGRYYLRKSIEGKYRAFGTYTSLEDAKKVRDYCILHGWRQRYIDIYCKKLGVTRVNSSEHVGKYNLNPDNPYEIENIYDFYINFVKPRIQDGEALTRVLHEYGVTGGVKYDMLKQLAKDDGYRMRVNGWG